MDPDLDTPHPSAASSGDSVVHRLDPRAKIVGLIGLVVLVVSTPARSAWAFILYLAVLLFIVGAARLPLRQVFRRVLIVVPFVAVVAVFVPFYHQTAAGGYDLGDLRVTGEGLLVLWNVGAKAVLGVLSMIVLGSTTGFAGLVDGFARLRAPRVFLLIVSFMYRYTFVFADEARRMRRAIAARNFRARWLWNTPVFGNVVGALFVRSYGRGERVYVAMVSRGYEGTVPLGGTASFGRAEALFLSLLLGVAAVIRVVASLGGAG
jgi:cobalt/nickel transport system permease protein